MTYEFGQRTWDLDDSCAVKVNDLISDDYVGFAYLNDPDVDENIDGTAMNRYCHVVRLPKDHKASDYEPFLKGS